MDPSASGSLWIFRLAGINVYLHWTWFVVAWWQISTPRREDYTHPAWKVAEYLTLFGIVLLHEFGHAFACRSVGGKAEAIFLWPLGGIAYVAPPARPGPLLWSIAAGPLVNLVLVAPGLVLWYLDQVNGWAVTWPDINRFITVIVWMNVLLLAFNLLPVYPLDGGQVLHALLWYSMGRWRALMVVSVVGGVAGGVGFFLSFLLIPSLGPVGALLTALVAVFIVLRSQIAYQGAQYMLRVEKLPRHTGVACPGCGQPPPCGTFWVCEHCQTRFDTFDTRGKCPACGAWYLDTTCPYCHAQHHIDQWYPSPRPERAPTPAPLDSPEVNNA
jgi:Zn-dependent protease